MAADEDLDLERKRRMPREQQARIDLQDLEEAAGENPQRAALKRTREIIGVRIAENERLKALWDWAANKALEKLGSLNKENYSDVYNSARDNFWDLVRGGEQAKKVLEGAGDEAKKMLERRRAGQKNVQRRRLFVR